MVDALTLVEYVCAGQIVVTEAVWTFVQGRLPALTQVISLGTHQLRGLKEPQCLMELSPSCISGRTFPPVPSAHCLVPGYRQAPSLLNPLTIMFAKSPPCPAAPEGITQEEFENLYNQVVTAWCDLVRRLLIRFNGYECKEPERGKFTLAFASYKSAMAFAVTAQENLMHLDYPDVLLQIEECREETDEETGQLLYRGLRASVGFCYGWANFQKPLVNTGRADYFGNLPNRAARLMGVALPGQIITEGRQLHQLLHNSLPDLEPQYINILKKCDGRKHESFIGLARLTAGVQDAASEGSSSRKVQDSPNSLTQFSDAKKVLALDYMIQFDLDPETLDYMIQFDLDSRFEKEVAVLPIEGNKETVGPVRVRGMGAFVLKGILEPVPLAEVSIPALAKRSKNPKAVKCIPEMAFLSKDIAMQPVLAPCSHKDIEMAFLSSSGSADNKNQANGD